MTLTVALMAGQTVGALALLALRARPDTQVIAIKPEDDIVEAVARGLTWQWGGADLLVSVHGRAIVPEWRRNQYEIGCINLHPYLSECPGADPVGRAIRDGRAIASVGAHWMTDVVDGGPVIVERYVPVPLETLHRGHAAVYQRLYPLYLEVLEVALRYAEDYAARR